MPAAAARDRSARTYIHNSAGSVTASHPQYSKPKNFRNDGAVTSVGGLATISREEGGLSVTQICRRGAFSSLSERRRKSARKSPINILLSLCH